jgi:serine/threonine-protein kinase
MKEHACTLSITRPNWPDIAACRATRLRAALNGKRAAQPGSQEHRPARQRKLRALRRRIMVRGGWSYTVEEVAGGGGMGVIYRARRSTDGQLVALKMSAHPGDVVSEEFLEREAEILSSLSHPSIVKLVEFGYTLDDELYLALEYIHGRSLAELLAEEPDLSQQRALNICAQIAEAMEHVHRTGIVHRDLKPANILISSQGGADRAHIVDFGISSSPTHQDDALHAGSLLYMSPEQILDDPLSCRSDVYQLGLLFFVCLFGRLPFEPDLEPAVAYRFSGSIFPDWAKARVKGLGPELAAILTAMLMREPAQRMASMGTVAQRLRELAGAQIPG